MDTILLTDNALTGGNVGPVNMSSRARRPIEIVNVVTGAYATETSMSPTRQDRCSRVVGQSEIEIVILYLGLVSRTVMWQEQCSNLHPLMRHRTESVVQSKTSAQRASGRLLCRHGIATAAARRIAFVHQTRKKLGRRRRLLTGDVRNVVELRRAMGLEMKAAAQWWS